MTPRVAVIIPHYDDLERLARCLAALLPGPVPEGVEVVVVDNGSPGDVAAVVGAFPGVRLVVEREKGAAPARNRGVAETTAPHLAFLDADCVPAPEWLSAVQMVELLEVIGGAVGVFDETEGPRTGAQAFETVFAFNQARYIAEEGFTVTANMLTTREIFAHVGGFRTGVSEDRDWCARARAAGYDVRYHRALSVAHPTRGDWPALRRKWLRLTEESFPLSRSRVAWGLRAVAVLGSPLRDVLRIWGSGGLRGMGERWRATITLLRLRGLRARWMVHQALGREIS
ncbi:MAG: glycosyltransferase [Pseudomonadota bacterium]